MTIRTLLISLSQFGLVLLNGFSAFAMTAADLRECALEVPTSVFSNELYQPEKSKSYLLKDGKFHQILLPKNGSAAKLNPKVFPAQAGACFRLNVSGALDSVTASDADRKSCRTNSFAGFSPVEAGGLNEILAVFLNEYRGQIGATGAGIFVSGNNGFSVADKKEARAAVARLSEKLALCESLPGANAANLTTMKKLRTELSSLAQRIGLRAGERAGPAASPRRVRGAN